MKFQRFRIIKASKTERNKQETGTEDFAMRKSMKRWIALGGAATMALSLDASGGDGTESGKGNSGKVKSVNVTLPTVYDLQAAEKIVNQSIGLYENLYELANQEKVW